MRRWPSTDVQLSASATRSSARAWEYERAATTELDAALSPLLAAYLRNLTGTRAGRRAARRRRR